MLVVWERVERKETVIENREEGEMGYIRRVCAVDFFGWERISMFVSLDVG